MNPKSDVSAKAAYKQVLEARGFGDVRVIAAPADITGVLNGEDYFFELKVTAKSGMYFGAATITEWEAALRCPDRFRFVVARNLNGEWIFREFTPYEFIQYSDIPPFKVYFRVPANARAPSNAKRRKAIAATVDNLRHLIEFRARLRAIHEQGA